MVTSLGAAGVDVLAEMIMSRLRLVLEGRMEPI